MSALSFRAVKTYRYPLARPTTMAFDSETILWITKYGVRLCCFIVCFQGPVVSRQSAVESKGFWWGAEIILLRASEPNDRLLECYRNSISPGLDSEIFV